MRVLLLSTYDLGRQPFSLASAAAWLRQAGAQVDCIDLAVEPLSEGLVRSAGLIAVSLPMHTATRLALELLPRLHGLHPEAHLCAYGLYAPLTAGALRSAGVDTILGPEFEPDLLALWRGLTDGGERPGRDGGSDLPRVGFRAPDRRGLPPPRQYARLRLPAGEERLAGSTEATRGCLHGCRHCPIVPVYRRRFRAVPIDVVLADIDAQVSAGIEHVTFADPDFLNGPRHAIRITEALHRQHPGLSYDVTVKVEHLLRDVEVVRRLRDTGCCLVTSAIESFDDRVLRLLDKRHTRADIHRLADVMQDEGLPLQPTFIAFHPWMTLAGYRDFLVELAHLRWVGHVSPVQLAIRLLVPAGSALLDLEEVRGRVGPLDSRKLVHPWLHEDPRVDRLQEALEAAIGGTAPTSPGAAWHTAWRAVEEALGGAGPIPVDIPDRCTIPYLTEPWYC